MKDAVTAARLREVLLYIPETGLFYWRIKSGNKAAGSLAGTPHKRGRYIQVFINGTGYQAHRIAWLYMTGKWPAYEIDHINGNGVDNRFTNLRDVSHFKNMQNRTRSNKNSATGKLGVYPHGNKFRSRITVNGKTLSLGVYEDADEAHSAYLKFKNTGVSL